MPHGHVVIFLILASLFAFAHQVAMTFSLYWYYWWFDVFMHFWGGTLVALGVHSLATFSRFNFIPSLKVVFFVMLLVTASWEIFELIFNISGNSEYLVDTTQDILLAFGGGLLAHVILRAYTMK